MILGFNHLFIFPHHFTMFSHFAINSCLKKKITKVNRSLKDEKNCNIKKTNLSTPLLFITNSNMNLLLPKNIQFKNWMTYSPIQIHNVAFIIFIYSFCLILFSSFFRGQQYYNLSWSPLMCTSSASQSILANWKKPFAKALKTQMILFTLS